VKVQQDIANNKRAKQMAKKLLPSLKVHKKYIKDAKSYCDNLRNSYVGRQGIPLKKIELIYSDLFQREYLVGFVDLRSYLT
jgi:hypothetical protein